MKGQPLVEILIPGPAVQLDRLARQLLVECGAPGEPLQAWTCTQASPDSLFQVGEVLLVDPEKNLI